MPSAGVTMHRRSGQRNCLVAAASHCNSESISAISDSAALATAEMSATARCTVVIAERFVFVPAARAGDLNVLLRFKLRTDSKSEQTVCCVYAFKGVQLMFARDISRRTGIIVFARIQNFENPDGALEGQGCLK
jgi:hypothetical protein